MICLEMAGSRRNNCDQITIKSIGINIAAVLSCSFNLVCGYTRFEGPIFMAAVQARIFYEFTPWRDCNPGYGRPSLRVGCSTLRGVVPYGTESSRKPGVLGCRPCDIPFRYASASILDFGFHHLLSVSDRLLRKCSIRIPQSAIVYQAARPSPRSRDRNS